MRSQATAWSVLLAGIAVTIYFTGSVEAQIDTGFQVSSGGGFSLGNSAATTNGGPIKFGASTFSAAAEKTGDKDKPSTSGGFQMPGGLAAAPLGGGFSFGAVKKDSDKAEPKKEEEKADKEESKPAENNNKFGFEPAAAKPAESSSTETKGKADVKS